LIPPQWRVLDESGLEAAYTHAWRDVDSESWGDVNVLAFVRDLVQEFLSHKRYQADGLTIIP